MLRKVIKIVIEFLFVILIFIIPAGIAGTIETHYNRNGIVIEVNEKNEEVVILDKNGNEWVFYGTGYTEGDKVTMRMFTNYTDNTMYDDTIVKVIVNNK